MLYMQYTPYIPINVNTVAHQYESKPIHAIPTNTSHTNDTYQYMIRTDTYEYVQIHINTCMIHAIHTNTKIQTQHRIQTQYKPNTK